MSGAPGAGDGPDPGEAEGAAGDREPSPGEPAPDPGERPWLEREEWADGRARSGDRREILRIWFAVLVWGALSAPLAWAVLPGQWEEGTVWAWVVVAFFLLGVWILVQALRMTLIWRRFGRLTLELDPFPGSPGGDVGGSVVVPVRIHARPELGVTLSCVLIEVRGGRHPTRWESVEWSRSGIPRVEPASEGIRVRFTFRVPEGLPSTGEPSSRYHRWMVRLTGAVPGVDLDATFEVPVFARAAPAAAADPAPVEDPEAPGRRELPRSVVRVEPAREGVRLVYPPGRDRRTAVLLVIFGAVFGGTAAGMGFFLIREHGGAGSGLAVFVLGFGALVLGGFLLFGLLLIGAGLYSLLNRLEVELSRRRVAAARRLLGVPLRREAGTDEVARVELSIAGQVGQGARARPSYDVRAFCRDGSRLYLGDGIPGPDVAESLARLVEEETGLGVERVPRSERTSSVGWRKAARGGRSGREG